MAAHVSCDPGFIQSWPPLIDLRRIDNKRRLSMDELRIRDSSAMHEAKNFKPYLVIINEIVDSIWPSQSQKPRYTYLSLPAMSPTAIRNSWKNWKPVYINDPVNLVVQLKPTVNEKCLWWARATVTGSVIENLALFVIIGIRRWLRVWPYLFRRFNAAYKSLQVQAFQSQGLSMDDLSASVIDEWLQRFGPNTDICVPTLYWYRVLNPRYYVCRRTGDIALPYLLTFV